MSEPLAVLLDQNVPQVVGEWLRGMRPSWRVFHTNEVGLAGCSDRAVFEWAQEQRAIVFTFDEDFADRRSFPVGTHCGVVRLRVWPTNIEETQKAIERLLAEVSENELAGSLVIVGRTHIRVRPRVDGRLRE